MVHKLKMPTVTRLANTLGILGYTSCLIQWLWLFATQITPLIEDPNFREWFVPTQQTQNTDQLPVYAPQLPELLQYLLMILATIFIVTVIVYIVKSTPKVIGKTGRKVTQGSAKVVMPHIVHNKKLPAKEKRKLFERITWIMKAIICAIPVLALFIPVNPPFAIDYIHVVAFGLFCAIFTVFWFSLQFIVVRKANIDLDKVW